VSALGAPLFAVTLDRRRLFFVIRILVVDDFYPWLGAVKQILSADPQLLVVGTALSGPEALQKIPQLSPDLVLLDVEMPEMDGLQVAREIAHVAPGTRVIFLSAIDCPAVIKAAINSGASAYVHKLNAGANLIRAIRAALQR
jgi:DNA-binding NarL/FixJ family response regulator